MKRSEYTQHARWYITCYKVEKLGLREQERSSLVEVADRFLLSQLSQQISAFFIRKFIESWMLKRRFCQGDWSSEKQNQMGIVDDEEVFAQAL